MDIGLSAFKTTDEPYFQDVQVMKVNNIGLPAKEILIDVENKDISLMWATKERFLYIILGLCSLFFLFVLYNGWFYG